MTNWRLGLKNKENKNRITQILSEKQSTYRRQQKLIDLDNTVIIIQDTPQEGLLTSLMPLLSQDSQGDQEYIFVEKTGAGKIEGASNILRGMPVIFYTRVIDDTRNVRHEEIFRRFINITPSTSRQKIEAANKIIGQKYSLLPEEYDEKVVSKVDKQKAKRIVATIVQKLKDHSSILNGQESGVKILFWEAIGSAMPSDDVWAMTVMDRTMRYLSIITKVNVDSRPRFVNIDTSAIYPISTFEDVKETLTLMEMAASNVRPYVANMYNEVFMPIYMSLPKEPRQRMSEYMNTVIEKENHIGLTVEELADKTKEILGFKPSGREIREKYLEPLINQGLINYTKSVIDRRENLYFPADEDITSVFSLFAKNDDMKLTITNPTVYPSKKVLEKMLITIVKQNAGDGEDNIAKYRLQDHHGTIISGPELIEKYLYNPELCFKQGFEKNDITNIIVNDIERQCPSLVPSVINQLSYERQVLNNHLHFYH